MARELGSQVDVAETLAPPSAPSPITARLGFVDGLRALAALEVVAGHMAQEIWPGVIQPGITGLAGALTAPFVYGHQAVSVFIVLSGFSLMLPVARNGKRIPWDAWGFYWRRARRILPPYYAALALSLTLLVALIGPGPGTIAFISLPVTWSAVGAHLALLQDFSPEHVTIDPPLWSVAVEVHIYLLFPLLVALWRRYHPLFTLMMVVILSFLLLIVLVPTWVGRLPGYSMTAFAPQFIGLFAMGMFTASVITKPSPARIYPRAWYTGVALAVVSIGVFALSAAWPIALRDWFIGVMTVGLLLAASRPGRLNPIRAALEWRPLVWIGGISYSLYLIHAPLIQVIWQYGLRPLGLSDTATYLALLPLGLPLIVAAAWGFWYCCERPFLNSRLDSAPYEILTTLAASERR